MEISPGISGGSEGSEKGQDRIFLSKEDRAYIEDKVGSGFFGRAEFLIDGYRVTLQREFIAKDRLGLMTYVGGLFKVVWSSQRAPEATLFFHLKRIPFYRGRAAAKLKKAVGKRYYDRECRPKKIEFYSPIWPTLRAALKAFEERNFSVQLLRTGHPILEAEAAKRVL